MVTKSTPKRRCFVGFRLELWDSHTPHQQSTPLPENITVTAQLSSKGKAQERENEGLAVEIKAEKQESSWSLLVNTSKIKAGAE